MLGGPRAQARPGTAAGCRRVVPSLIRAPGAGGRIGRLALGWQSGWAVWEDFGPRRGGGRGTGGCLPPAARAGPAPRGYFGREDGGGSQGVGGRGLCAGGGEAGLVFVLFSIAVAAAEAAVGMALVIAVHRHLRTIRVAEANRLKG